MLNFLSPRLLLTDSGFQVGFHYIKHVIFSTHRDPLLSVIADDTYMGTDPCHHLTLLHLVARSAYRPLLEYVMAACAARLVSNSEHLLAIDPSVDYRGDSWTSRAFNDDAYEVRRLFHGRRIKASLFRMFVVEPKGVIFTKEDVAKLKTMKGGVRAFAYECAKRQHRHSLILKKAVEALKPRKHKKPKKVLDVEEAIALCSGAESWTEESAAICHLLEKLDQKLVRNNLRAIGRAVGVPQSWRVLAVALEKWPDRKEELLRCFLMGELLEVPGTRPVEELRAIWKWGS